MFRPTVLVLLVALATTACTGSGGDSAATSTQPVATSTTIGPDASSTTTTTTPPDGFGGTVSVATEAGLETLNPFAPNSFGLIAGSAIWATVYDIDPETWQRVPDVVNGLPSHTGAIELNDDGTMTVRYEIAAGATWSDGEPITGDDLAFTAEAMRDLATRGNTGVDPVMGTVTATDSVAQVAFITFAEPTLAFEDALWIILPKHALEGVDLVDGTDGSDWPSGGPFVVDGFEPARKLELVRNPYYWKTDDEGRRLPYLDGVTMIQPAEPGLPPSESASLVGLVSSRAADVAVLPPVGENLSAAETLTGDGLEIQQRATPIIEQLTFNFRSERLDDNPDSVNAFADFRRALAVAIDRQALLDETGVPWLPERPGLLNPADPSAWQQYEAGIQALPELPEGAASVLWTTGNGDYRIRIGDALEGTFTPLGVAYRPNYVDSVLFFGDVLRDGTFDVGMWAWISDGGYSSQVQLMEILDPRNGPPDGNFSGWGTGDTATEATVRFSELVDEAKATVDPQRFSEIVAEADAILASELPLIPLFSRGSVAAVWPDTVSGVVHNGSRSDLTWNIETWQRVGE